MVQAMSKRSNAVVQRLGLPKCFERDVGDETLEKDLPITSVGWT